MEVRPSEHAQRQMQRRGIASHELEEALDSRQTTYPSVEYPEERTVILGTTANGRRLKLVVVTAEPEIIVTVADRDDEE